EIPEERRLPAGPDDLHGIVESATDVVLSIDDEGTPYDLEADGWPAQLESSGTWLRRGFWYAEQDVVILSQGYFSDAFLAVDISNARFDPQLFRPIFPSSRDLVIKRDEPGAQANARLTLGRFMFRDNKNRDHMVEFTFFGLGEWTADKSVKSVQTDQLMSPLAATADRVAYIVEAGGFNFADEQRFHLRSRVNSFEWNYRLRMRNRKDRMELGPDGRWTRKIAPGLLRSYLFGLRYFTTDEKLLWQSTAVEADIPFAPPEGGNPVLLQRPAANGEYKVRASNDVVGLQFGADFVYQWPRWSLGLRGKAGPYINFSRQNSDYVINDPLNSFFSRDANTPDRIERRMQATETNFALLGELGVFAHYNLRPNVTLRVAYEAMWLSSVANAQEQITFDPVALPIVKPGGGRMYMGASVGIDFYW
ncbi:MAG: BBP7 family outer membrane beta-barrel protein, partial [Pirellulales bacterium]